MGTPLLFMYGHDVLTLRDAGVLDASLFDGAEHSWLSSGHAVYWVSVPGKQPYPGGETLLAEPIEIHSATRALQNTYDHKSTALSYVRWRLSLAKVEQ